MTYIGSAWSKAPGKTCIAGCGAARTTRHTGIGRNVGQALQRRQHHRLALRRRRFADRRRSAAIAKTDLSERRTRAVTGVRRLLGRPAFTIRERLSAPDAGHQRLWSGWTGPRRSFRRRRAPSSARGSSPTRIPHKIFELLKATWSPIAPADGETRGAPLDDGRAALIPFDIPEDAGGTPRTGWGHAPVFTRRRQHFRSLPIRRLAEHPGGDDGLRAGQRRAAPRQRALQRRDVPARHRTAIVYLDEWRTCRADRSNVLRRRGTKTQRNAGVLLIEYSMFFSANLCRSATLRQNKGNTAVTHTI